MPETNHAVTALVELVQAPKVSRSQIIADPETGDENHVIQDRLTSRYETPCLGFGKYELLPERRNVVLVLGCDDTCPRQVKLDSVPREFALYSRRHDDLRIEITQQVEFAYGGEVEDWGSVGNDDQAPGSLVARCRSCSRASIP